MEVYDGSLLVIKKAKRSQSRIVTVGKKKC